MVEWWLVGASPVCGRPDRSGRRGMGNWPAEGNDEDDSKVIKTHNAMRMMLIQMLSGRILWSFTWSMITLAEKGDVLKVMERSLSQTVLEKAQEKHSNVSLTRYKEGKKFLNLPRAGMPTKQRRNTTSI